MLASPKSSIEVHHAFLVSVRQGVTDLLPDVQSFIQRQRTSTEAVLKSFTLDEFKDQIPAVAAFLKIVNAGNVGVIERGEDLSFPLEARDLLRITGDASRKDLDRNFTF